MAKLENSFEPIKVINAWGLSFELGSVLNNIASSTEEGKDELEELKKAQYYLNSRIETIETERKRASWRKNKKNARKKPVVEAPVKKTRAKRTAALAAEQATEEKG